MYMTLKDLEDELNEMDFSPDNVSEDGCMDVIRSLEDIKIEINSIHLSTLIK